MDTYCVAPARLIASLRIFADSPAQAGSNEATADPLRATGDGRRQFVAEVSGFARLEQLLADARTECRQGLLRLKSGVLLSQYSTTLRRKIVPDNNSEISHLARQIYLEHREAIELIYSNRPDWTGEAKQIFKEAVAQQEG